MQPFIYKKPKSFFRDDYLKNWWGIDLEEK